MTKEEYDEMVEALESTTPAGLERDLKRNGIDTTKTNKQLFSQPSPKPSDEEPTA